MKQIILAVVATTNYHLVKIPNLGQQHNIRNHVIMQVSVRQALPKSYSKNISQLPFDNIKYSNLSSLHAQGGSGQELTRFEVMARALKNISTQKGMCVTIINDSNSPTNVRLTPIVKSGNIVGRLNSFTFINVINNQNGWLEIDSPIHGWISLNLTHAGCGDLFNQLNNLYKRSLSGDRNALDLLVRYTYQTSDGATAEILFSDYLPKLLQKQPELLIRTLDSQLESDRRQLLENMLAQSFLESGTQRQSQLLTTFETKLVNHKNSPTAKTLKSIITR